MSGTKSPSLKAPATEAPWPLWKLGLLLYPFVAATVAINLFMLGLIASWIDWQSFSPLTALAWCIPLGVPATWLAARWLRRLLDEAA